MSLILIVAVILMCLFIWSMINNQIILFVLWEIFLIIWICMNKFLSRQSVMSRIYFFKQFFTAFLLMRFRFYKPSPVEFCSCSEQNPLMHFEPALSAHLGLMDNKKQGSSTERQCCSEQCRWEDATQSDWWENQLTLPSPKPLLQLHWEQIKNKNPIWCTDYNTNLCHWD